MTDFKHLLSRYLDWEWDASGHFGSVPREGAIDVEADYLEAERDAILARKVDERRGIGTSHFLGSAVFDPGVHTAFTELNTPGAASRTISGGDLPRDRLRAHFASQDLTTVDLKLGLTAKESFRVSALGYNPRHLTSTLVYRDPLASDRDDTAELSSNLFRELSKIDLGFQRSLAAGHGMIAFCPVSGKPVTSRHGFCQHFAGIAFNLYRFDGVETFYVCTGGFSGGRMFIYMPRTNLVVHIMENSIRWYDSGEILRRFNINMLANRSAVGTYLAGPSRPVAVLSNNNLGHYFWNNLGGVHAAIGEGLAQQISAIINLETSFLPVHSLCPELAHIPEIEPEIRSGPMHHQSAFALCVREKFLPICFTSKTVSRSFAQRVRDAALKSGTNAVTRQGNLVRPLIWINLRAHKKIWLNQIDGYANILNAVAERFGKVSVLLDGLPNCEEIAAGIRSRTDPRVVFHDGLRLELLDSLAWAFSSDAYICTIGSGLVLLNWLADKPGVAHANQAHMEQLNWWGDVRPDAVRPLVPPLSEIVEDGDELYGNYDVDWRILADLLFDALGSSGISASSTNAPVALSA